MSYEHEFLANSDITKNQNEAFHFLDGEGRNIFNNTWNQDTKPVEMYRTDLISAMKVPDCQVLSDDFIKITDSWKEEYDKGVQVPVNVDNLPKSNFTFHERSLKEGENWVMPEQYHTWKPDKSILDEVIKGSIPSPIYDMDEDDYIFLNSINTIEDYSISEIDFETIFTYFDCSCHINMVKRYQQDFTHSIQFDDSIFCEVCKDIYSEPGNEMIFCDLCNICVHQSCYGISAIPQGDWLCSPCKANCLTPVCLLCMQGEGAFKATSQGEWVHVFCALWIPEVGFGNVEKMAPVTKIKQIPASRWSLTCNFCQERVGTCIQCSEKSCFISFHPTCAYINQCHMMTSFGIGEGQPEIVQNFAYCLKHTSSKVKTPISSQTIILPLYRTKDIHPLYNNQVKITRTIQKEFFNFIDVQEISLTLSISVSVIKSIYNYWKEKRKLNGNNPLISLPSLGDLVDRSLNNSIDPNETNEIDPFLKLVSIRQDLERARVLCHMALRREKLKKKLIETYLPVIEFCLERHMQFPISEQFLQAQLLANEAIIPASDEDAPLDLSQSNIFCSPIKELSLLSHPNPFDNESKSEEMVVAHEIVLKGKENKVQSEGIDSDNLAYNYHSSEDPEWDSELIKKSRRKGRKKAVDQDNKNLTANHSQYKQKVTIQLSEKSDVASSMDESCKLSTPPNSPEFNLPGQPLPLKRRNSSDSSSYHSKYLENAITPPSPKDKKKTPCVDPVANNDTENVTPVTNNDFRRSKRHKPNPKYL